MPLGVFALTPDGQASGPDPTLFLQLAISKEGIISGTLNNTATEKTQTIEGMADKTSQRCAWTVAGKTRPIMETGISNLTEDTAPALVHFADGQTQQWLMVRLEEPAAPEWIRRNNVGTLDARGRRSPGVHQFRAVASARCYFAAIEMRWSDTLSFIGKWGRGGRPSSHLTETMPVAYRTGTQSTISKAIMRPPNTFLTGCGMPVVATFTTFCERVFFLERAIHNS